MPPRSPEDLGRRALRRVAALAAAFAAWMHLSTVGEWLSVSVLGAWEETTKSVVRGWFAAAVRWTNEFSSVLLSVFSRQNYPRRRRWAAAERGRAWESWWASARGTFNALIEQEGLYGEAANVARDQEAEVNDEPEVVEQTGIKRGFWRWRRAGGSATTATAPMELDFARGRALFTPAPAGTAVSEVVGRRGLVEDFRVHAEVAISKAFAAMRRGVRAVFFLDRMPPASPRGAAGVRGSGFSRNSSSGPWRGNVFTASDAILRAGYPLEEHAVTTSDGYVLQMQRIPRHDARDVVFFQHGVLDTSLGWVASGAAGSAAFAAHDAGFDVWLANTRANPPRLNIDPARKGARYWAYSANDLALCDITAQINHIHGRKIGELGPAGLAGRTVAAGEAASGGVHPLQRSSSMKLPSAAEGEAEVGGWATSCADRGPPGLDVAVDHLRPLQRSQSSPRVFAPHSTAQPSPDGKIEGKSGSAAPSRRRTKWLPSRRRRRAAAAAEGSPCSPKSPLSSTKEVDGTPEGPSSSSSPASSGTGNDAAAAAAAQEVLPYRMQAVGHSLGAACLLIYTVTCRMRGEPHRLQRLVLLSPAGFHPRVPLLCRACIYTIPPATALVDWMWPGSGLGLRLPGAALRWLTFKLWADLRQVPALMDLVGAGLRAATSGDASAWHEAMALPHYSSQSMPACSLHTSNHFAQWARDPAFRLYDYGSPTANRARYGTDVPPSIAERYGLLDIPVDLVAGTSDGLIAPENVEQHLRWLREAGRRCSIREFDYGHLDFTFGIREEVMRYVLSRLRQATLQ